MDKNLDVKSLLEMIKAGQITSEEAFRMYKTRLVADSGSKTNHGLTAANSDPSQAMVFFSSEWLLAPIRPAGDPAPLSTPVIVFDYSERFAKTLGEKAPRSSPVILVTPGESFNKLDNFTFEINIRRPNDYRSLFSELIRRKIIPESLIYLLPFRDESRGRATVDQELDCGFYSLLSMAKGLIEQKTSSPMTILYFYPHEMGLRRALHSAMSGFARTLQIECPRLSCKTVEIKKQDYAKGVTDTDLVRVALTELGPGHREELEVLHAGEKRYLRGLKEMRPSGNEVQSPLKVGGVYLITGGAGGIGRVFAERLAISGRSKLIIAGLSPITDESRAFIRKLESYGAEAVYCQTDLTSRSQVEEMVATARNRFEVIDGVIHCAGVNRNSLLLKKTVEEAAQTLSPKIQGAINLDEALKNEKLDFFVMFSSLVAVKGNIGQADYAYANRFLDCFAEHRNDMARRSQREGKTLSINWPPWEGGGMVVDNRMIEWARKDSGIETLNCEQGIQGFELALSHPGHQIAVAFGDAEKIKHTFGLGQSTLSARSEGTANVSGGRVLKDSGRFRDEVEGFLKDVLSRETKMPVSKMCSTEPFEKYGIDSMMIMSLTHDLEIHFGKLSKTLFFEYQNIAELAEYFINNHADKLIEKIRTGPAESYGESVLGRPVMAIQNCPPPAAEVIDRRSVDGGKIAIIGIAGRYPQARDLDEFWDNLKKGKDCVTEIPAERWNHDLFFDADRDKTDKCYSKWGGFIDDVDKFDPLFFNISPKEAELMDPQERLFLQTVHQAVEDAGYTRSSLSKSKVGVFAGVMYAHYQLIGLEERLKGNAVTPDSFFASIPNRVSYYFNLRGPSIALDTLCSSSLTAIHLACESIRSGECEMAIAGGVNLTLHPNKYLTLSQGKFASTDGRCRSFGEGGDGYVPGEGVGSVLLKPLAKAVLDGDHIYAVIRATAVNHGGKSNGITVPNPQAQSELIKDALKKAGIAPRAVSYLEAHGTGTALGDPIEIRGLTRAFNGAAIKSHSDEKQYCAIGSVKSNIGHLESAAGIAGITKVVLQMRHGRIAPSIHSESLNPHIDFSETPFYVQRELTEWAAPVTRGEREETHHPRIAGVSSFGAGGSNAHVILEEYTDPNGAARSRDHGARLIVLSARTEQQLVQYAEKLYTRISEDCGRLPLADLAYTLQTGREAYDSRLAIVAANCDALAKKLNAFCRGEKSVEDLFVGVVNKERVEREQSEPQGSIGNKDPATLAELWVKGVPIDWEELYAGSDVRRLSLPTYPFAKERCWIARAERPAASLNLKPQAELHPFIDRNTSTLEEQKYSSNFSGGEPLFADHKVGGQIVAPGAVILEMVRAGGELAGSRKVRKVKDVAWTSPIIFPPSKEPIEVNVSFHPNANNVDYEVWTATEGDSRHIHSRGRIIYEDIQRRSEKISLATLYAECAESLTGEQCYERFQKHGLEYGPRFRAIRELRSSDTATVAA
ncbi:MAG: SDR family NAD(P)-dependent oxidoreductase, partial [Chloracidobacterium sp.]|nr:SDR family NAD(P)-dependent oxidoreductase [Chloracidobacterium sp.]